jgi:hypothetical protein
VSTLESYMHTASQSARLCLVKHSQALRTREKMTFFIGFGI